MRKPKAPLPPLRPKLPAELVPATVGDRPESDRTCSGLEYRDQDLSCEELVLAELEGCRFENVRLADTRLHRTIFSDCAFVQCDLANVEPHDSSLVRVHLAASRLVG